MSEDWLVRGTRPLELTDIIRAVEEAAPGLSLRADAGGRAVVVVDGWDRPVVWVCQSREVHDPADARLLPAGAAPRAGRADGSADGSAGRSVWTEVTGPTDRVTPPFASAHDLVGAVARALAAVSDGDASRWSAASLPDVDRPPSGRSAQDRTGGRADPAGAATGAASVPAGVPAPDPAARALRDVPVDVVTEELAILVQSRPVLTATPWLLLAQQWAAEAGGPWSC